MRVALFQPDIPQNAGAMARLCACLGVGLDVIEPCGFVWDDRKVKRAGMDYLAGTDLVRHRSWEAFRQIHPAGVRRLVLLTTAAAEPYHRFAFRPDDILLAGRESAGVPDFVHNAADARLIVPMVAGFRSLNVVNATALVLGEALRQTGGLPSPS